MEPCYPSQRPIYGNSEVKTNVFALVTAIVNTRQHFRSFSDLYDPEIGLIASTLHCSQPRNLKISGGTSQLPYIKCLHFETAVLGDSCGFIANGRRRISNPMICFQITCADPIIQWMFHWSEKIVIRITAKERAVFIWLFHIEWRNSHLYRQRLVMQPVQRALERRSNVRTSHLLGFILSYRVFAFTSGSIPSYENSDILRSLYLDVTEKKDGICRKMLNSRFLTPHLISYRRTFSSSHLRLLLPRKRVLLWVQRCYFITVVKITSKVFLRWWLTDVAKKYCHFERRAGLAWRVVGRGRVKGWSSPPSEHYEGENVHL